QGFAVAAKRGGVSPRAALEVAEVHPYRGLAWIERDRLDVLGARLAVAAGGGEQRPQVAMLARQIRTERHCAAQRHLGTTWALEDHVGESQRLPARPIVG